MNEEVPGSRLGAMWVVLVEGFLLDGLLEFLKDIELFEL